MSSVAPEFVSYWLNFLQHKIKLSTEDQIPDFYKMVELFRNNQRQAAAQKGRGSHSAFAASFQGQQLDKDDSTPNPIKAATNVPNASSASKKKDCLCGNKHKFKDCLYLIESLRPSNWKPDQKIQKDIETKLSTNSRLKTIVVRIQKKAAKDKNKNKTQDSDKNKDEQPAESAKHPAAFTVSVYKTSSVSDYHLRDSFILDSGANIHMCNNRERFTDFRPTDSDRLYAGNAIIPIEEYGSVLITVQAPEGPRQITLKDTALVSSFHTNIVSLDKFIDKDVHWDTKQSRLTYGNNIFCQVKKHYGQ